MNPLTMKRGQQSSWKPEREEEEKEEKEEKEEEEEELPRKMTRKTCTEHPNRVAVFYCLECSKYFCGECEKYHDVILSEHKSSMRIDFDSLDTTFTGRCPTHTGYMLDYLCHTHNTLCCTRCRTDSNGDHTMCNVIPIDGSMCDELPTVKATLGGKIQHIEVNKLKPFEAKQTSLETNIKKTKMAVKAAFDELRRAINEREDKLNGEIEEIYQTESGCGGGVAAYLDSLKKSKAILDELNSVSDFRRDSITEVRTIVNSICKGREALVALDSIDQSSNFEIENYIEMSFLWNKSILGELETAGCLVHNRKSYKCVWKECPKNVEEKRYSLRDDNPSIAKNISDNYCTIVGDTSIPLNAIVSWEIKILDSMNNNGGGIYIGVAPFDINQNNDGFNNNKYGWYFNCYSSSLWSGYPHNYSWKEYGPRNGRGEYMHAGDSIGVIMDMTKGELSFTLNEMDLGVAFEGIPLDKPLVPCVLLGYKGDSVELNSPKVKETVIDSSIPAPSNIIAKSMTWDSITLTWDGVSNVSSYQIEVDGSKSLGSSKVNTFTKARLLPGSEHNFRVRAVKECVVGEWSDTVKSKISGKFFEASRWKECPDEVDEKMKYKVDENNLRIAKNVSDYGYCTIIGNTFIPFNRTISWDIKVLKSGSNSGDGIFIGIAPFDVSQNDDDNYMKYGWYFNCHSSTLWSGPPHDHRAYTYGPRKEKDGQYVHTGDSIGIVIDTTKGELSFALNGVDLGVAFEGIPLDKPLVPCALLSYKDDSVEIFSNS